MNRAMTPGDVADLAALRGVGPGRCGTCGQRARLDPPSFNRPRPSVEGRIGWTCRTCGEVTTATIGAVLARIGEETDATGDRCPYCGRANPEHDGPTRDDRPSPGDVSICWGCRQVAVFDDAGRARLPTPDEAAELRADPKVRDMLALLAESYTPGQASALRWGAS